MSRPWPAIPPLAVPRWPHEEASPWPAPPQAAVRCRLCAAVMWTCCASPAPSVAPPA